MSSTAEMLQRALSCHQANRADEAERLYRAVLAVEPQHVDALHLLGVLELQRGQLDAAARLISSAIAALAGSNAPPGPSHAPLHVNLGNVLQASGRSDEAIASYRRGIVLDPNSAPAFSNLGNILQARGDFHGAIANYQAALRAQPAYAEAHYNLGNAYAARGQTDQAVLCYRQALQARPNYVEAMNNLANALASLERTEEAIAAYEAAVALSPRSAALLVNLGTALRAAGRLAPALERYREALAIDPSYAEGHYNLGNALYAQGALEGARACYARAIELDPHRADAHFNLGNLLKASDEIDEAAACYRKALAACPTMVDALFNLGNLLQDRDQLDEAVGLWQRLLAIQPDHAEAHASLGNGLHKQGQIGPAIDAYRHALVIKPDLAEAHYNLANALQDDGQIGAALEHYRQAVTLQPNYVEAHWNRSLALLLSGDLKAGWPEYEWRWRRSYSQPLRRPFAQPLWRGEPLDGKRILLHAEQGLGDTLQFCRYATLVAARHPAHVILEVPEPLSDLMADSFASDVIEIVPMDPAFPRGSSLPPFDLHCPLMSLPLAFDTTLETIPADTPYLRVDPAKVALWSRHLAGIQGFKVGLVWAGGIRSHNPEAVATDRRRSVKLAQLAPLASMPGVTWYSLQKGAPAAQLKAPPPGLSLIDLMDEVESFADTAALVAQLDLVISVDTAVAHLAGGLGIPVWLLSRFDGCWRWLLDRDDSPWYPQVRLYRQQAPGEWAPVIARVARDLGSLAAARKLPHGPRPADN